MSRINAALLVFLLFTGCDLEGANDERPTVTGVFVANQGNFGDGNGSVSTYDPAGGSARADAVTNLGSIVQSVAVHDGRLYVMSNSANRVDVFDAGTLQQIAQISNVTSPRYMVVKGSKAYVTSLFGAPGSFTGGKVTVLDLAGHTIIGEIEVGDNPDGLALSGDRLYVANHGFGNGTTVSVIDTNSDTVVQTLSPGCDGPRFLVADAEDEVFVFCTGRTIYDDTFNVIGETDGAVVIISPTGEVVRRIEIEGRIGTAGPGQDVYHDAVAGLAFAVQDERRVLVFDTALNALTQELDFPSGDPIGAVAYDRSSERLYLGRNAGFTTAGRVTVHAADGFQVSSFGAGIAPSYILLNRGSDAD